MKAIQVTQTGGPEVLTLADLPAPTPKANEVLLEIKAIGINFIDVYLLRSGIQLWASMVDSPAREAEVSGVTRGLGAV